MISLALHQLRANWRRTLAVFISVALGVAFVTVAMLAGGLYENSLRNSMGRHTAGADIVISSTTGPDEELQQTISAVPGVEQIDPQAFVPGTMVVGATNYVVIITDVPQIDAVRSEMQLVDGAWPTAPGEIALSQAQADRSGLRVGDTMVWKTFDSEQEQLLTVVGIAPNSSGLGLSVADGFVMPEDFEAFAGSTLPSGYLVKIAEGQDPVEVRQQIQAAIDDSATARTFPEFVDYSVDHYAGGALALEIVMLGFAAIAMFAAGIVITNSFEISIAQRTRDVGLMRSIGATSKQVRRMILAESAAIGLIASAIGVAIGIGLILAANVWIVSDANQQDSVPLPHLRLIAPLLLGVFVTIAAALGPARTAMRVKPLQALRQSSAPVESRQASRLRKILAIGLLFIGTGIMGGGVASAFFMEVSTGTPMLIGMLGGALSFLGILASAQFVVPWIAHMLERAFTSHSGVTTELAFTNLNRNPRRTASTTAALLVGVTLITMMTVGVTVVKATLVGEVNKEAPIDLEITARRDSGERTTVSDTDLLRWQEIAGVQAVIPTRTVTLTAADGSMYSIVGVDQTAAARVVRTESLATATTNDLVVSEAAAQDNGLVDGQQLTLQGSAGVETVTVRVNEGAGVHLVVATEVVDRVHGESAPDGAWIRLDDDADVAAVLESVREGIPAGVTLDIAGSAASRDELLGILDTLLLIAIGLLGASVVIAVVGIGNTLTLSVIERTRETGMLRTIGLKRGQVRAILATEGLLLALIGCIIGLIAGVVYGIAGVYAVIGDALSVHISIPWLWLAAIAAVAIACGLLASVLPARRSLQVQPVEAIADLG